MNDKFFENISIMLWNGLGHPSGQLALRLYLGKHIRSVEADSKKLQAFAEAVAQLMTEPEPPIIRMEKLLDDLLTAPPLDETTLLEPLNQEAAPAASVMAYWSVAKARPEWRNDEIGKLEAALKDKRSSVRNIAQVALSDLRVI